MALSLNNIFGRKGKSKTEDSNIVGTTLNGNVVISQNVNWKMEGVNNAGTAKGDTNAFRAGLGSCFARIKKSQELDVQLQDKMRVQLSNEKTALEGDLDTEKQKLDVAQTKFDSCKEAVADKQREIAKTQQGLVDKDKATRLNFIIGATITAFLTIYLFIFYSSTAYSAFFRNFQMDDSLEVAMFDGNAIIDAFKGSLFQGLFCLFMPFIFLGLGFVAHGFGLTSKGFARYAKTILVYLLTFAFDFLIAYKISKSFYDIEVITSLTPMQPYSIRLGIADVSFWIVIFCGFVSYVIWGLVFDFTMTCYDRLTNNKYELQTLNSELGTAQVALAQAQSNVTNSQQKINGLQAKIRQKEHELNTHVRYDYEAIRQGLADYFFGWTSYYGLIQWETEPLQTIYQQETQNVEKWINNKTNIQS